MRLRADGTLVSCEDGGGTTATFQISEDYVALPEPMTLAQAESAIGNVSMTQPAARARHGVLPAGVYWVGDGYSACDLELAPELCIAAGAAVVAGIFDDAKAASQALTAVDASGLEPGYPLVVHTDERPSGRPWCGCARARRSRKARARSRAARLR